MTDWRYYLRRFKRIVPPYLIWTVICVALRHRADLRSIRGLTKDVLLGTGVEVGYFVIVLVQFVLLTPLLARIDKRRVHIVLMALLLGCGLTFTYLVRIEFPASPLAHFPYYCILFLVWYPFYHLGLFAAKFHIAGDVRLRNVSAWVFALYLFLVAASMGEAVFLHRLGIGLDTSQLKASSLLASLALFVFALSGPHKNLNRLFDQPFLCFLGRESYVIYLCHLLFLTAIASFLKSAPFFLRHQLLDVPLTVTLTLILSAMLASLIRGILPNRSELLGA